MSDLVFGSAFKLLKDGLKDLTVLGKIESITLIRDVYGRIRIFLEMEKKVSDSKPEKLLDSEKKEMEETADTCLKGYFTGDIWVNGEDRKSHQELEKIIIKERKLLDGDNDRVKWYVLERYISKKNWLSPKRGEAPWSSNLVDEGHKPAIVSFYSFKGGTGRTTSLAATALTLARHGYKVAIIDLDLEAPGVSSLFLKENDGVSRMGVIDYLIEKRVQGSQWLIHSHIIPINDTVLIGDEGEPIYLFPAGTVDDDYLMKLARLDFQNVVDYKLKDTLVQMIKDISILYNKLDFIFLDARAGFHDIGGLAISEISHATVVFGNNSRQTWAGLKTVIKHLAYPEEPEPVPLVLVNTMASPLSKGVAGDVEINEFKEKAYDIFKQYYYDEEQDVPNLSDTEAPFYPVLIRWKEVLRADISLHIDEHIDNSNIINNYISELTGSEYQELAKRICNLFGKDLKGKGGE